MEDPNRIGTCGECGLGLYEGSTHPCPELRYKRAAYDGYVQAAITGLIANGYDSSGYIANKAFAIADQCMALREQKKPVNG